MKSLFERLRSHRLASTFVLLAALSAALVGGSFAAHGVRGQEKQNDSSDATPLKVNNSSVAPNEFVKIAKAVGPAVVNINTQTLPKNLGNKGRRFLLLIAAHNQIRRIQTAATRIRISRRELDRVARVRTTSRTSSTSSSAARFPIRMARTDRFANRSAPGSSSIPRATSSRIIT